MVGISLKGRTGCTVMVVGLVVPLYLSVEASVRSSILVASGP